MKNQFLLLFTLCFGLTLNYLHAVDVHNDWHLLAKLRASKGVDRDEVEIRGKEGLFTALQFKVRKSAVEIYKCTIVFGDGSTQEVEMRDRIPAGGQSRIIDLKGNHRVIQKIIFWYTSPRVHKVQSLIEVWGRH